MKLLTFVISSLFICFTLLGCSAKPNANQHTSLTVSPTQTGASQPELYLPLLKNKRVGVVVNQTSVVNHTDQHHSHLVDFLLQQGIQVQTIFAPEHGFRGNHDAGEIVKSGKDVKTGIDIISIYGSNKKPSKQVMANLDVIVFDIQDVGVRFYTYISSMHYVMQAAAENSVEMLVLDRPNPNIQFVNGPVLENEFRSFVGMHPIPLIHGLTVGELAQMIVGENWLAINSEQAEDYQYKLALSVIPVKNYSRYQQYPLPIAPSPNLPNAKSVQLYASLCLFEATEVSVGRGTDFPFQVLGHENYAIGDFEFTPRPIKGASSHPKFDGVTIYGQDLRQSNIEGFDLSLLLNWYQYFLTNNPLHQAFFTRADFMDLLSGTDQLRKAIESGQSKQQIEASWQRDLAEYKRQRARYLLYP